MLPGLKVHPVVQKLIELDLRLSREFADMGEKVAAKVANK